jgi:outer membrane receptor protein involved in Fe transport
MHHRVLGALAFCLVISSPAYAQRTTGSVAGTVRDASGAVLPAVTVSVTGANVVGTQTTITNEEGFYRFTNLPPGAYDLVYALTGFKTLTSRGLRVGLGMTAEGNVNLEVSQLAESIDVVAEAPVVDTESNEVGTNFDRTYVENAPLRRLSFFDLVAAAPGALQAGDNGFNAQRTMSYGSSYDENSFQLDGVDITETYFNEALAEPNTDAIEEVEVLALGAPAEYGNASGAVYNIVTRQGSNEFHGDLNFFYQGDGLTSNNTTDLKLADGTFYDACPEGTGGDRCPFFRDTFRDFSAQLGGPLIKDKLWFFGSYGIQRDYFAEAGTDTSSQLSQRRKQSDRYMGKLTWQVNPRHKVVGNFHYDKRSDDYGISTTQAPTEAFTRRGDTPTPGIAYTGILSSRTVVDVRYSGFYGKVEGGPTDPDQPRDLDRFYDFDTGTTSGGWYYWYLTDPTKRQTATAKISHQADDFLASSHDFRFGVQYSDAQAKGLYGYNDFVYTYTYEGTRYGYGYDRQPFSYSGNARNLAVFFDDTVRVNDRLAFNVGLRVDRNNAYSAEQDELDEFAQPTGVQFPRTDLFTWTHLSPRLGFNWKLTPDGRTVLKGHYGRYHRAIATGEYANVIGPNVKATFSGTGYDFTTGDFSELTFLEGNENLGADPDYKAPRTDQFIVSLEREIVKGLGTQLNYVYKRGRDYATWSDISGVYEEVPFTDDVGEGATGRTFPVLRLVSDPAERQFRITNGGEDVGSDVHAVSFGILKRMTGKWQLNASVTWLRGTGRVTESVSGVGISQRGGLQFRDFGKNPNDYVNTDGRLRLDVTWSGKAQFLYQLPWDFLVSGNLAYRDGAWSLRRARVPADLTNIPEGTVILLQRRGENDRIPNVTQVDMRLQKDFRFGKDVRLGLFVDGLNLLNDDSYETVVSSLVTSDSFNEPSTPIFPRRFMLGAKFRF